MTSDDPKDRDVTAESVTGAPDGESVPLTRCPCGATFALWDFILTIYPDMARACPQCGRKLYAEVSVRVFEVTP